MPQIDQDPTNVPCPDFAGAAYTAVRQIMSKNGKINNEQAVKQLMTAWNQTHTEKVKAWNQQVQADLEVQQEQIRLAQEDEMRCQEEEEHIKEDERREQGKRKPKVNDFDKAKRVADHVMPRPLQFTIGKLKSFNFIELWYFTDKGCAEAQDMSKAQSDDTYSLTKVDNLVALKPVASFKALRNVVLDADLTWRQMNISKNTLLWYMDQCNWPQKHVQSFTHFYFNIKIEPMQQ